MNEISIAELYCTHGVGHQRQAGGWLVGSLVGWWVGWLVGELVGGLWVGWLVSWLMSWWKASESGDCLRKLQLAWLWLAQGGGRVALGGDQDLMIDSQLVLKPVTWEQRSWNFYGGNPLLKSNCVRCAASEYCEVLAQVHASATACRSWVGARASCSACASGWKLWLPVKGRPDCAQGVLRLGGGGD